MSGKIFLFLFSGMCFAAAPCWPSVDSTTAQATFSAIHGKVTLQGSKTKKKRTVHSGSMAQEGDRITTGKDSSATILLFDGSQLEIGAQSSLVLSQLQKPSAVDKLLKFRLLVGQVLAEVKKLTSSKSSFEIQAGGVVCGVRGTVYSMFYQPDAQTVDLTVSEGTVYTSVNGGNLTNVNAGQTLRILHVLGSKANGNSTSTGKGSNSNGSQPAVSTSNNGNGSGSAGTTLENGGVVIGKESGKSSSITESQDSWTAPGSNNSTSNGTGGGSGNGNSSSQQPAGFISNNSNETGAAGTTLENGGVVIGKGTGNGGAGLTSSNPASYGHSGGTTVVYAGGITVVYGETTTRIDNGVTIVTYGEPTTMKSGGAGLSQSNPASYGGGTTVVYPGGVTVVYGETTTTVMNGVTIVSYGEPTTLKNGDIGLTSSNPASYSGGATGSGPNPTPVSTVITLAGASIGNPNPSIILPNASGLIFTSSNPATFTLKPDLILTNPSLPGGAVSFAMGGPTTFTINGSVTIPNTVTINTNPNSNNPNTVPFVVTLNPTFTGSPGTSDLGVSFVTITNPGATNPSLTLTVVGGTPNPGNIILNPQTPNGLTLNNTFSVTSGKPKTGVTTTGLTITATSGTHNGGVSFLTLGTPGATNPGLTITATSGNTNAGPFTVTLNPTPTGTNGATNPSITFTVTGGNPNPTTPITFTVTSPTTLSLNPGYTVTNLGPTSTTFTVVTTNPVPTVNNLDNPALTSLDSTFQSGILVNGENGLNQANRNQVIILLVNPNEAVP